MRFLGLELDRIDVQAWLEAVRDFALPRLIQSAGVLLLAGILYWVVRWILRRVERWVTVRTETEFDDALVRLVRRAALLSIVFWTGWRLAYVWELAATSQAVVALWIVGLTLPASRFVADVMLILELRLVPRTATKLDETALPLMNKIARFLVVGVGVLVALAKVGIASS